MSTDGAAGNVYSFLHFLNSFDFSFLSLLFPFSYLFFPLSHLSLSFSDGVSTQRYRKWKGGRSRGISTSRSSFSLLSPLERKGATTRACAPRPSCNCVIGRCTQTPASGVRIQTTNHCNYRTGNHEGETRLPTTHLSASHMLACQGGVAYRSRLGVSKPSSSVGGRGRPKQASMGSGGPLQTSVATAAAIWVDISIPTPNKRRAASGQLPGHSAICSTSTVFSSSPLPAILKTKWLPAPAPTASHHLRSHGGNLPDSAATFAKIPAPEPACPERAFGGIKLWVVARSTIYFDAMCSGLLSPLPAGGGTRPGICQVQPEVTKRTDPLTCGPHPRQPPRKSR